MFLKKLGDFLNKKYNEAEKLYNEAEKDRHDSGYTDIDALEQSCYNRGVMELIEEIKNFCQP